MFLRCLFSALNHHFIPLPSFHHYLGPGGWEVIHRDPYKLNNELIYNKVLLFAGGLDSTAPSSIFSIL